MKKRILSLILVFVFMVSFVYVPVNSAYGITDKQKYEQNKEKIKQQEKSLKNSNQDIEDIKDDIEYYEAKIKKLDEQLKKETKERDKISKKLEAAKKELNAAKEKKKKYDSLMKKRLQVMYMYEDTGYLDVLFSSSDFSDFISKFSTIKELVAYDQEILSELKKAEKDIQTKTDEIASEKAKYDKVVAKLNSNKEAADTYKAAKNRDLTDTNRDVKAIKQQLAMLNKEQAELGSKLYKKNVAKQYSSGNKVYGKGSKAMVNVAKAQLGNAGGRKFWSWYGFSWRVSWCACFVSWCANQCGYIKSATIPKFSYVDNGAYYFKRIGRYQGRSYRPKGGDIIFFDWDGNGVGNHVGIVEYTSGNTVHTIEGNSGDAVRRRSYTVGSRFIMGYGVPKY